MAIQTCVDGLEQNEAFDLYLWYEDIHVPRFLLPVLAVLKTIPNASLEP